MTSGHWLGQLGRSRPTRSMVQKRCRDCQAPVRWAETNGGWKVKLDWHPAPGSGWAIDPNGIARQVNKVHANQGIYRRHICEGT